MYRSLDQKGTFHLSRKGFTLVELAIVMTIIGLLIGGILKGQELLENARMTSAAAQLKSIDSAALTFRDVYKALPGDLRDPSNFLQSCTTSPCNISGNGDGIIAAAGTTSDETGNFWLHMSKAGLIGGVDPSSNWTAGTIHGASSPASPLGGQLIIREVSWPISATLPEGMQGRWVIPYTPNSGGAGVTAIVSNKTTAKFDLKIDDGKPWVGTVHYALWDTGCAMAVGATAYDPNNTGSCFPYLQTGF